ncbi:MAG: BamA/TamA family outer membrane protein, partial [Bacteroidales bacterium]|nr:BamA/TamA family outer membrane protein [Candidatus Cryptobacteroides equifaecalis]
ENVLTLYDLYKAAGLISEAEAKGGYNSAIWAGLLYDTRDKEGAPTRGIWAEGHIMLSPKWLGSTNESYRYSFTWRHYLPIVKNDVLTFAYRINYEGTFGKNAPFYMLPFITDMGEGGDRDGFGGYRTVRGILRSRVWGLDNLTYTAEFRWRFVQFPLWNQNIALGLSVFSDGSMVTRGRDLNFNAIPGMTKEILRITNLNDSMHVTTGAGFRFIMNENFIVAAEYGLPISKFMKNSPIYRQDGDGAFYINIGYLF